MELFIKTLSFSHRNTEQPDLELALDLAVFLELSEHCSEEERNYSITLHQPLIGTVGEEFEDARDKIIDIANFPPEGLDSNKIDD